MTKDQFKSIARHFSKEAEFKVEDLSDCTVSENCYGKILNLGEHEEIPIVSLTCPDVSVAPIKESDKAPEVSSCIKLLYDRLKESFSFYSEQMILYYLYKRPGINGVFSTKELYEFINGTVKLENEVKKNEGTKTTPEDDKGIDLLDLPTFDEESMTATCSDRDKKMFEAAREKIVKGQSSLLESESEALVHTKNLVGIERP